MSCLPLLIFYNPEERSIDIFFTQVPCRFGLVQAVCYLVRVQVSVGLSLHHMGSLIHGSVESQISAIVTVCWWVDQDWKWLSWKPVMTSTNLKIYFESMLGCAHWHIILVVGTCLFLLFSDTYNAFKTFQNSVSTSLLRPYSYLIFWKNQDSHEHLQNYLWML